MDRSRILQETTINALRHFPDMSDEEVYNGLSYLDEKLGKFVGRADRELRLREIIATARKRVAGE